MADIKTRIQQLSLDLDTQGDKVLKENELVIVRIDNDVRLKVGDGISPLRELPYVDDIRFSTVEANLTLMEQELTKSIDDVKETIDQLDIPEGVTVDAALSSESENPVQNKVVKKAIDDAAKSVRIDTLYDTKGYYLVATGGRDQTRSSLHATPDARVTKSGEIEAAAYKINEAIVIDSSKNANMNSYKVNGTTVIDSNFIGGFWIGESKTFYANNTSITQSSVKPGKYLVQMYSEDNGTSEPHVLDLPASTAEGVHTTRKIEFKIGSRTITVLFAFSGFSNGVWKTVLASASGVDSSDMISIYTI